MPWRDTEMDRVMGRLLRSGVLLAGGVVLLGGIAWLFRHGGELPAYGHFHGVPNGLNTVGGVLRGLREFRPEAVIQFGILLMIATPVLRVAFCIAAFAIERDWRYTLISAVVLGLLMYGIFGKH